MEESAGEVNQWEESMGEKSVGAQEETEFQTFILTCWVSYSISTFLSTDMSNWREKNVGI